jgi:hypothetical protein
LNIELELNFMQQAWYPYNVIDQSVAYGANNTFPPAWYDGNLYGTNSQSGTDYLNNIYTQANVEALDGRPGYSLNAVVGNKLYFTDVTTSSNCKLKEMDLTDETVSTLETITDVNMQSGGYSFVTLNEDATTVIYTYQISTTLYIREWNISGASGAALANRTSCTVPTGFGIEDDGTVHLGYRKTDTVYQWDEWTSGGGWVNIDSDASYAYIPGYRGYTYFKTGAATPVIYPPASTANSWDVSVIGAAMYSSFIYLGDAGSIEAVLNNGTSVYFLELTAGYTVTNRGSAALTGTHAWRNFLIGMDSLSETLYLSTGNPNERLVTMTNNRRSIH